MAALTPTRTRRADRSHDRPAERARAPASEPEPANGAHGGHDLAALPAPAPREVALAWPVQAKLSVSSPGDPLERQADAVAARVSRGAAVPSAPPGDAPSTPGQVLRQVGPADVPASTGGPVPARGPGVPRSVEALVARPGGGQPLDPGVRARIEPHLGTDLSSVRVRRGPEVDAAAAALQARAFTSGGTIYLRAGESASDASLMAHEATHVAQQNAFTVHRSTLMRDFDFSLPDVSLPEVGIPDFVLRGVTSAARSIPGYTLLTQITGSDPLTDEPVQVSREQLVEELLAYGPFGAAVGQVLSAVDVLGDVFDLVTESLAQHNLTTARIGRDIDAAWAELSVTEGIDGNVAIVRRYVNAILTDVRNFVAAIVGRVIEIVRTAAVGVVEPLLQTPEIAPMWDLVRKVLHHDPLRDQPVEAATVDILGDFLRLIGQEDVLAQMQERGTLQETADWLDIQFATFATLLGALRALFSDAWEAIQPENLPDLLTNLGSLATRAFDLVRGIADFATTVIAKVLELVKHSLLGWLSTYAHQIPGFHLLTVILEQNPFTGDVVERTAENLIKGFITLLPGGEATYDQLAESGVIGSAAERIETEMTRLGISVELITSTFLGIWDTLSLDDLLDPIGAFVRVVERFGDPLARIVEFVTVVVEVVLTLVLQLMNFPSDLLASIIANAMRAIEDIQRDPVGFLVNMLDALKAGFTGFFDNIGSYLLQGLVDWLFRGLGQLGITLPTDLSLQSILGLVLDVLGVSVEMLWQKLGEHIGEERVAMIRGAIDTLTGAWSFIRDVQERGLTAIWEYVVDQLSGLWDTLLGMARDWILTEIVQNVTARLISMLDPTGVMAIVNSFVAFFNAVQSAIEYLRDILEIVNQYVTTFAEVAAGNIVPGAEMIEQGLANAVPIAIGFLANQVGIGNVPEKIVEIIQSLRQLIDQALDWLFEQAVRLGSAALAALTGAGGGAAEPAGTQPASGAAGDVRSQVAAALLTELSAAHTREQVTPIVAGVEQRFQSLGVHRIVVGETDETGGYPILVEASPLEPAVLMRLARPGWTVRAAATLRFSRAVTLESPRQFYAATNRRGAIAHPDVGGAVQVAQGDFDLPGAQLVHPEAGPERRTTVPAGERLTTDVLQVVSQNFRLPPNAREHNNHSHAEYKLVHQVLRDVPRDDWSALHSVELEISRMPCAMCCQTLAGWFDRFTGATVALTWTHTHPEQLGDFVDFPTSTSDLQLLERPNVIRTGPDALFATAEEASRAANARAVPVR
ncbi:DUF4157 domain-containing protein [Actinopolymorpha sp. B9G3]|uniref:eCIS core domain-containing protein n=1 Tax=Actinopolymorpha sp. B9G3 TaxID=3158970 RepID=UPI0032D8C555